MRRLVGFELLVTYRVASVSRPPEYVYVQLASKHARAAEGQASAKLPPRHDTDEAESPRAPHRTPAAIRSDEMAEQGSLLMAAQELPVAALTRAFEHADNVGERY